VRADAMLKNIKNKMFWRVFDLESSIINRAAYSRASWFLKAEYKSLIFDDDGLFV
jgi:hypothetical protein